MRSWNQEIGQQKKQITYETGFFKGALLSISLLTGSATAITSMLPLLFNQYAQLSQSLVESLVTVTSLTTCLFTLLSHVVSQKIGRKKTVQLGIVLTVAAGILPFFFQQFRLVMVSRLILGAGIGLFTPLAISMISMFFTGKQRAVLLGYQVGVTALGNSLLIIISGGLMNVKWNWGFLVYLAALPILLLFSKVVPEPPNESLSQKNTSATKPATINKQVLLYIILCFFTFLIIWSVQIKLPELFVQKELGNTQAASWVLSLMNMGGLLAGLSFGQLFIRMQARLLPISYLFAGVLVVVLSFAQQFWMAATAAVLFNFVYSFTGPYIITKVNELATAQQLILSTALISVAMTLSQFATPFFWNTAGALINAQSAAAITRLAGIFALLIGAGLAIKINRRNHWRKQSK